MIDEGVQDQPVSDQRLGEFCAVVYFHGMGSQRRYEEVSRLVEAIDVYLHNSREQRDQDLGYIYRIRPRLEQRSDDPDKTISYVRTYYKGSSEEPDTRQARFFEVYWAPVMAGQGGVRDVLKWMFKQVRRPFEAARAPWRERQRLRRSALMQIYENKSTWPPEVEDHDFRDLLQDYDAFEGHAARRTYQRGLFRDFMADLTERYSSKNAAKLERLRCLAQAWKKRYALSELYAGFTIVTMALGLLLVAGLAVGILLLLLQLLGGSNVYGVIQDHLPAMLVDRVKPTWMNSIALGGLLATFLGLSGFLTSYMGDVQAWTTYEETNTKHLLRQKVIDAGVATLKHVLSHERCARVVIVSHSLGTSVAHDTLLALARLNKASPDHRQDPIAGPLPLTKISHFVSIASPIDKVQYLFESYKSKFHRYKRVVEELRGDIGDIPFTRNTKPYVHWINYWDEGDIISGPLHSPSARNSLINRVDNVHVPNFLFPAPGASHAGYFINRKVIGELFEMIFFNQYSFAEADGNDGQAKDYAALYREPGDARGMARFFFSIAAILVYLGFAYAITLVFGFPAIQSLLVSLITLAVTVIAGGYLFSSARGHRHPI